MYTVKQLSRLAGVTPRTLHYYDEIGLLKPSRVGDNGYRYYGEEALLRLQQILLFRELDMPLEDIRDIMGRRDFDVMASLERHRAELFRRMQRLERLIGTVDDTLLYLKGQKEMNQSQLFSGFSEEQQAEYEKEAMQMYDPEVVKASAQRWKGYSAAEKQRVLDEGRAVYEDMIKILPGGPASPEAQAGVQRWREHMNYFWTPTPAQLVELAEGYVNDPRFRANFDQMDPRLAEFMLAAVRMYVDQLE